MSTKTPVTVLQELMVKHGTIPYFEFLEADSNGAFQCRVKSLNATAIGKGRSKKDSKHEAARIVLEKLAQVGKYFPNDSHDLTPSQQSSDCTDMLINHVGILKDLCFELHMSNPEYDCMGETGLAHSKQFTIKCTTGSIQRSATAASKKQAKQLAAEKIYIYLNENLQKRILEAAEQDNLNVLLLDKSNSVAISKYFEKNDALWKPNLGQKINEYHFGFTASIERNLIDKALILLKSQSTYVNKVKLVEEVFDILQLDYSWSLIKGKTSNYSLLKVPHVNPPIFITVPCDHELSGKMKTANEALDYMKLVLSY